ncbi:MAG: hypothetical protein H7Y88_05280 [Phycisphaerales bacterium]|nr:hypothetical protein [Phycisphaerales bacterium]
MKTKMKALALALLAGVAIAGGCDNNKDDRAMSETRPAMATVNSECPYTGGKVNPATAVSYKGQNVGFCCNGCASSWAKLTDAEKDTNLAAVR